MIKYTPPTIINRGSLQIGIEQNLYLSKDGKLDGTDIKVVSKFIESNPFSTLSPGALKFRLKKNTEAGKYYLIYSANPEIPDSQTLLEVKRIRVKKKKK